MEVCGGGWFFLLVSFKRLFMSCLKPVMKFFVSSLCTCVWISDVRRAPPLYIKGWSLRCSDETLYYVNLIASKISHRLSLLLLWQFSCWCLKAFCRPEACGELCMTSDRSYNQSVCLDASVFHIELNDNWTHLFFFWPLSSVYNNIISI